MWPRICADCCEELPRLDEAAASGPGADAAAAALVRAFWEDPGADLEIDAARLMELVAGALDMGAS